MLSELPPLNHHHHLQQPRLLTSKSSTSSAGLSTGSTRPSTANSSSSNTFQRREDYYSDTSDSDSDPEVEDITKKGSRQSRNPSFHRHPIPTTSSPLFPGTMNLPSSSQQQGLKSSDLFSFHPPSTPNSPSQSFNHIHMSGSSRAPPSPHPKKDSKPCSILRKSSSSSSSTSSSINNHHHQGLRKKSSSKPSLNSSTDNQEWSRGIVDLQDERQRKELELKLQSEEQSEMIFENQRGFNRDLEGMLGLNLFDVNDDDDEDDKFHQYDKVHQDQLRSSSSQLNTNQKNGERKISKQRNSRSSSDSSSRGLNSHHGISFNNKHKNSIRSIRKGRSESSPIIPSEKSDHLVGQHFSSLPPSPCSSPKLKHKTSSNSNGLGLSNLETISSSNPSSPKHSFNLNLPGYDFIPSTLSTIPPTPSAAAATWIDPSALNYFPAGLRTKEKSRKSSFCKDRNGSPRKEKNTVSSPRESSDFGGTLDSSIEINNRSSTSNQITSNTSSPTSSDTSSSTSTLPQTPSDSDHHKKQVNCPATSAFKEISDPTHGSKMYYFRREVQNLGLKIRFGVHDVKKKLH